jgi:hypothetical protein
LFTADFVRVLVGRACVEAQVVGGTAASVVDRLEHAEREFYWCLDKGSGLSMFREPPLQIAAHRHLAAMQPHTARRRLRQAVAKELEDFIDSRRAGSLLMPLDDAVAVAACSWLVELRRAEK